MASRDDTWATDKQIVIGVVGVTGSGKSSLIKRLTQCDDVVIGHGTNSETQEIKQYSLHHNGRHFVIVDSPGFDDTDRDDEDVFHQIASWMETSFRAGQMMNGLIYLHPIIQPRQKGSEIRNLWMFKKLVGKDNFCNVILGLTFCDQEHDTIIDQRKKELIETPEWWGDMVSKGSQVKEIALERHECLGLLDHFAPREKVTLKFQQEVVEQGLSISQTDAAQTILHKEELDAIRMEEREEQEKLAAHYKRRMDLAAADYHARTLRDRLRSEIIESRQSSQRQAMLLQIQIQEQVERRDKLRLWDMRIQEEAEEQRVEELSEALEKHRLENDKFVKRLKEKEQIKNQMPLWKKRKERIAHDLKAVSEWGQAGHIAQNYIKWVYTDKPEGDPNRDKVMEHLLTAFCDYCLKSFRPGETYNVCLECAEEVDSMYPNQGFAGGGLAVCQKCIRPGRGCFNSNHKNVVEEIAVSIGNLDSCQRYKQDPSGLYCDGCRTSMTKFTIYLRKLAYALLEPSLPPSTAPWFSITMEGYPANGGCVVQDCCACNEDHDLCISCWGKGRTCKDTTHSLNLIGQCPQDLKDMI